MESKAKDKKQNRYQMTGVGYQKKQKEQQGIFIPAVPFSFALFFDFFLKSDIFSFHLPLYFLPTAHCLLQAVSDYFSIFSLKALFLRRAFISGTPKMVTTTNSPAAT